MPSHPPKKLLFAATLVSTVVTTSLSDRGLAAAGPLHNGRDRPACGNIGQRGRADAAPAPAVAAPRIAELRSAAGRPIARTAPTRAGRAVPLRALLRSDPALVGSAVARPLLAENARPACSNHIGKGGASRRCELGGGVVEHYRGDGEGGWALRVRTCTDATQQIGVLADGTVAIDSLVGESHAVLRPGDPGRAQPAIARCLRGQP